MKNSKSSECLHSNNTNWVTDCCVSSDVQRTVFYLCLLCKRNLSMTIWYFVDQNVVIQCILKKCILFFPSKQTVIKDLGDIICYEHLICAIKHINQNCSIIPGNFLLLYSLKCPCFTCIALWLWMPFSINVALTK